MAAGTSMNPISDIIWRAIPYICMTRRAGIDLGVGPRPDHVAHGTCVSGRGSRIPGATHSTSYIEQISSPQSIR